MGISTCAHFQISAKLFAPLIIHGASYYILLIIKRYEPFETSAQQEEKSGIYIYFSMTGNQSRVYHYFASKSERDKQMQKLDELFNITY